MAGARTAAAADAAGAQAKAAAIKAVTPTPSGQTIRERTPSGVRSIVGFMGIAVIFAVIGNEIQHPKPAGASKTGNVAGSAFTRDTTIILGGFTGAAVLSIVAKAGDAGQQFAVGLAAVTMVSSMIVYGAPVWKAVSRATGGAARASTPTNPTMEPHTMYPINPGTTQPGQPARPTQPTYNA